MNQPIPTFFRKIIRFPLYKDDGTASVLLNPIQKRSLERLKEKLHSGAYRFVDNPCLCKANINNDLVISKKDRYGISIDVLLCRCCGLIRLAKVLDDFSLSQFYRDDYRDVYIGCDIVTEDFFNHQKIRGARLYSKLSEIVDVKLIDNVFEIGCGAGGILSAFQDNGMNVSGCDYDEKYLKYGVNKGLSLYVGSVNQEMIDRSSQDLVILSHVFEHLTEGLSKLADYLMYMKEGGYILIEVPGTFMMGKPIDQFHIAHTYLFYGNYMKVMIENFGLEVVYDDEFSTIVARKPQGWISVNISNMLRLPVTFSTYAKNIENLIITRYVREGKVFYYLSKALDFFHLKRLAKRLFVD